MHRARALSDKMNNGRADGHCYSFVWIKQSWTLGDPYFSFDGLVFSTDFLRLAKILRKSID